MCKYCLESNTKLLLKIETPWQSPNRKYAEIWSIQFCFGFTIGLSRNNDIKNIAAIAFFSWLSLIYHTFDILFGFNESKKIMNVYKYTENSDHYDKKKRTRGKIIRRQDQRKNKRERKGERKRVTKSKTFMKRL